jgi:predicted Zn-dependent protease
MDHSRGLTETIDPQVASHAADCPDCGAPSTVLPSVTSSLLGPVPMRRCFRCGLRRTCEPVPRKVRICALCRLPHLDGDDSDERCAGCRSGEFALEAPEPAMAAATEAEVRRALVSEWGFVGAERTSRYLDRVLQEIAATLPDAPESGRVVLVRETAIHSLALPSGTVILTVGGLAAIEDGAELAFVLAHELAHAASGDAAAALVRTGLRILADAEHDRPERAWSRAALDLIRLGHGDRAEHEADAAAIGAMAAQGYDTAAAVRYLERLHERTGRGEPELAELALAHPPAADRLRRVDRLRSVSLRAAFADRVDREVFRRVAGHSALASDLVPVKPFDEDIDPRRVVIRFGGGPFALWVTAGLVALAILVLLYVLL